MLNLKPKVCQMHKGSEDSKSDAYATSSWTAISPLPLLLILGKFLQARQEHYTFRSRSKTERFQIDKRKDGQYITLSVVPSAATTLSLSLEVRTREGYVRTVNHLSKPHLPSYRSQPAGFGVLILADFSNLLLRGGQYI